METKLLGIIQRPGIDHDPVRPYVWATLLGRSEPVEIMSYPSPESDGDTIMIRLTPGDPTTLKEVPFKLVACFDKSRWHIEDTMRKTAQPKVKFICPKCESNNVALDVYSYWDVDLQVWRVEDAFDKDGVCRDCGEAIKPKEAKL